METQQSEGRSTSVCAGRTSTLKLFFFLKNYFIILFMTNGIIICFINRIAYIYFTIILKLLIFSDFYFALF